MKKFQTILMFLLPISTFCQPTATANCSSITVNESSIFYTNPAAIVTLGGKWINQCEFVSFGQYSIVARFSLFQEFLASDNSRVYNQVAFQQSSPTFSNLSHGTYVISVEQPTYINRSICVNGHIDVYNTLGQYLGYKSSYANSSYTYTGSEVVGQTQQSDVDWSFIQNGFSTGNSSGVAFDFGEEVVMSPIKTVNYTAYWIAIFESGSTNRNRGTGWVQGQRIFDINLSEIWSGSDNWKFEVGNTYTVQYAISNDNCPAPWTNLDRSFYVCPAGANCRLNTEKIQKAVTISPNPAQNTFQLNNFDKEMYKNKEYSLTINDISGKQIKSYKNFDNPNFDIADLPNGLYIVNLSESNKKQMSRKLVISR